MLLDWEEITYLWFVNLWSLRELWFSLVFFFINYNIVFPLSFFISFLQYSTLRSSDAKILGAAVSHKTQGGHCSRWESSVLTFVFTFDAVIFSYYDCVSSLLSSSIVFCRLTEDSLINCSYILLWCVLNLVIWLWLLCLLYYGGQISIIFLVSIIPFIMVNLVLG